MTVGSHDEAIRCVEFAPDVNVIISGSWDSTVRLWDPRGPSAAGTFNQPDKVTSIFDYIYFMALILLSWTHICLWALFCCVSFPPCVGIGGEGEREKDML